MRMNSIDSKIDELLGRQSKLMSLVESNYSGRSQSAAQTQLGQQNTTQADFSTSAGPSQSYGGKPAAGSATHHLPGFRDDIEVREISLVSRNRSDSREREGPITYDSVVNAHATGYIS
ncbi:hypothetical protein CEUSTIGMA_g1922.t1 [Chlamydomonas eustigma]|uniref:Uncharacterized protein n=1 Tax=Chlamydomonas eustigma TaxID=1157962 RepID=A0A250WUG3_9CHLO|nr:hypothetical protein CEUSTIGMA_g1922.t1 [Chlamydomonas eustigma]|eukprot:GAX74473.1 hypothetical protein CEUSTIGMA_g1922.t1 [Chlamydomonas eustigma]